MSAYDDLKERRDSFLKRNPEERRAISLATLHSPLNFRLISEAKEKAESWCNGIARSYDPTLPQSVRDAMYLSAVHNGPVDAVRHCYWSALLTATVGYSDAIELVVTHEFEPGYPNQETMMDLHNDAVGVEIGMRCASRSACGATNAAPLDAVLQVETLCAMQAGRLVMIDPRTRALVPVTSLLPVM